MGFGTYCIYSYTRTRRSNGKYFVVPLPTIIAGPTWHCEVDYTTNTDNRLQRRPTHLARTGKRSPGHRELTTT